MKSTFQKIFIFSLLCVSLLQAATDSLLLEASANMTLRRMWTGPGTFSQWYQDNDWKYGYGYTRYSDPTTELLQVGAVKC